MVVVKLATLMRLMIYRSYDFAYEMIYEDIQRNNPSFSVPKRRITAIIACDRVFGTSLTILELTKAILLARRK